MLIFHEDFLPLVEKAKPRLPFIKKYILITDKAEVPDIKGVDVEYEEFLAGVTPLAELPDLDENTQATLAYTTGTTGKPKGVYFSHRQLVLQTTAGWGALTAIGNYGGMDKHEIGRAHV